MCCPLCRAPFPRGFAPTVDLNMQKSIRDEMPEAFEKRRAELIRQKEWAGNKKLTRFTYGNTYKKLPAQASQTPGVAIYSYAVFFILNED